MGAVTLHHVSLRKAGARMIGRQPACSSRPREIRDLALPDSVSSNGDESNRCRQHRRAPCSAPPHGSAPVNDY
jgi:hypothetical protein